MRFRPLITAITFAFIAAGAHAQVPGMPTGAEKPAPAPAAALGQIKAPEAAVEAPAKPQAAPVTASPSEPTLKPVMIGAGAPPPEQQVAAPASTSPAALASAVDAELTRLAATQRQSEMLSAEVQLLNLQTQVNDLRRQAAGNQAGTTGLPQLVGMVSTSKGVAAEFLAGGALLQVTQGDWVSAEWRLSRVLTNGVEITRANGRERHTLMFGGTAQRAASAYETR